MYYISLDLDDDPDSEEIQEWVELWFKVNKEIARIAHPDMDFGTMEFVVGYLLVFKNDSDMRNMYKKILGEDEILFLSDALYSYFKRKEPEKYALINAME